MLDYQLFQILIAAIEAAQPAFGLPKNGLVPSVPIYQRPQVTQQGIPTGPCGFLQIIGNHRYGTIERIDRWDEDEEKEIHTEVQNYRTTFQFDALATQDAATEVQYSASDIVNLHAALIQSDRLIAELQALDIGIERVIRIGNVPVVDDRDRFELAPSFDFTITHKQVVQSEIPVLQSTEIRLRSV